MFRLPIVKFFSRILNRITITVVLVALQVAWLLWAFFSQMCIRDSIYQTVQLLAEHPDVRDFYQTTYKYLLVDEYQDKMCIRDRCKL